MQPDRGHRFAIMAIDGDYTNVGIAAVSESDSATCIMLTAVGFFCVILLLGRAAFRKDCRSML